MIECDRRTAHAHDKAFAINGAVPGTATARFAAEESTAVPFGQGPPMLATITKTASPRHPNRRAMRQLASATTAPRGTPTAYSSSSASLECSIGTNRRQRIEIGMTVAKSEKIAPPPTELAARNSCARLM